MPSIRHKITTLSILLVIITAGAVTLLFHWSTSRLLERNTLQELGQEAYLQAHELAQHIRWFENDVRLFAAILPVSPLIRGEGADGRGSPADATDALWREYFFQMLTESLQSRPAYLRIRYIQAGEPPRELARAERFPDAGGIAGSDARRTADRALIEKTAALEKGDVYLSKISLAPVDAAAPVPVLLAAAPVYGPDGTPFGVLVIETRFANELTPEHIEHLLPGHTLYLTDEEGRYLAHPQAEKTSATALPRVQTEFPEVGELLDPGNRDTTRAFLHRDGNGERLLAFWRVPLDREREGRSILVGMSANHAVLAQGQEKLLATSTLLSLLLVLAAGLLAFRWSQSIVRPLREMTRSVDALKSHQPHEPPADGNEDEAAILARSFREALDQIEEQEEELRTLNAELEAKVTDRTRALSEELAERQRVEADLNRFKTTLDLTLDCVFMFEPDTLKFFYVNRGATEQVGYTHGELMRMYPYDIKPYFDEASFRAMIAPMLDGRQKAVTFETIHQHKNGTDIPVEIFLQYVDPPGESPRFVAIVRDITERKRTEDALHLSQGQLETAQRIAHIGHWDWDIETGALYWSDEIYRLFGLKPQEFGATYEAFLERIHPDDRDAVAAAVAAAVDNGKPYAIEHRIIRSDGTEAFVYEVGEMSRSADGKPLRMVGTVQDISERKKIDRLKDEFISTVSHELRTPLTSIRGSLGLLTGGALGEPPEQMRSLLQIASNNTERLLLLINDILDISKIESGKTELYPQPVAIGAFLEQAITANQAYAEACNVKFRKVTHIEDTCIHADSNRLMQVMSNIMSNAAKFAPPGSDIEIGAVRTGDLVRISVTDHGPGIPKEFRSRVFDKFTQADASDTRQVGGTGLGLSIAKAIVEAHGGHIGFVTDENAGTVFYFDLPEWREPRHSGPSVQKNSAPEETILICENNPDIAAMLRMTLAQSGCDADIARDGAQARRLLAERRYRAMTLDLMLPDGDGLSLLKDLREEEQTKTLPVIVVSAKADDARQAVNGNTMGVIDWISKPVDSERLRAAIAQASAVRMEGPPRILHVEDDPDLQQVVDAMLKGKAEVVAAPTLEEARRQLQRRAFDLLLLDADLPDGCGLELSDHGYRLPPVVLFSAQEVNCHVSRGVEASLVKSRTSNKDLVDTILSLIDRRDYLAPPGD